MDTTNLEDTLEALVDQHGMVDILTALSTVCILKEEHLNTCWQDRVSAYYWKEVGRKLDSLVVAIE